MSEALNTAKKALDDLKKKTEGNPCFTLKLNKKHYGIKKNRAFKKYCKKRGITAWLSEVGKTMHKEIKKTPYFEVINKSLKEVALTGKSAIFIYSTEVASIPDIEALKGGMIETLNESDDFKKGDIIWFDIDKETI